MTEQGSHLVGIVVVSHSRLIAEGVVQLASEMAGPDVRLLPVGGTADGRLGTDANAIAEALRTADDGAGVLVLVDLGSAVLATDMAIESLAGEPNMDVRISRGPLVEGAVVAAVQASIGQSLGEVLAAAEAAAELDKGVSR
jgi:phosphoenolpyruvate---glycerone phosphotransferase subunit DhaM